MGKRKNLIGQKFGKLTVMEFDSISKDKRALWKCLCECGNEHIVSTHCLTTNNVKSCGCGKGDMPNLVGQKFFRLTVISFDSIDKKSGNALWNCKCDCGNERLASTGNLNSGRSKSCGCYKREIDRKVGKKNIGCKNGQWKGGITLENVMLRTTDTYRNLRKFVLKRDYFRCCICHSTKKLNMHHIRNFSDFPELRFDEKNNITLCKACHDEFHKRYTRKNNSYFQLILFKLSKQI